MKLKYFAVLAFFFVLGGCSDYANPHASDPSSQAPDPNLAFCEQLNIVSEKFAADIQGADVTSQAALGEMRTFLFDQYMPILEEYESLVADESLQALIKPVLSGLERMNGDAPDPTTYSGKIFAKDVYPDFAELNNTCIVILNKSE